MTSIDSKKIVCDIESCKEYIVLTKDVLSNREIVKQGWIILTTKGKDTHICYNCKYSSVKVYGVKTFEVTSNPLKEIIND